MAVYRQHEHRVEGVDLAVQRHLAPGTLANHQSTLSTLQLATDQRAVARHLQPQHDGVDALDGGIDFKNRRVTKEAVKASNDFGREFDSGPAGVSLRSCAPQVCGLDRPGRERSGNL